MGRTASRFSPRRVGFSPPSVSQLHTTNCNRLDRFFIRPLIGEGRKPFGIGGLKPTLHAGLGDVPTVLLAPDHAAANLVFLDGFEQRLEVAFAKPLVALALDDFEEDRADHRVGEDLQQDAVIT